MGPEIRGRSYVRDAVPTKVRGASASFQGGIGLVVQLLPRLSGGGEVPWERGEGGGHDVE